MKRQQSTNLCKNQRCQVPQPDERPLSELLKALAAPNADEAWRHFLEIYASILLQVVHLFETGTDEAADCFLYVCEQLCRDEFRRLRRFHPEGPASFATWLRAVARNLCLDWRRHKYGRVRSGAPAIAPVMQQMESDEERFQDPHPDPETLAVRWQRDSALRLAVANLPAPERLMLRLRFDQGLTLSQIARLTGIKDAQTVDRRLKQILGRLRANLDGKPGTESV